MKVLFTETAASQIETQIAYIATEGSVDAALRVKDRILSFIYGFLTVYPKASRFIEEKAFYETMIPRTNFVLFYRLEEPDILRVLALFHARQKRSGFTPDPT